MSQLNRRDIMKTGGSMLILGAAGGTAGIASAQETLTVSAADAELAAVLGVAEASPSVIIERTALGYDRTPLEYRLSRAAAENFRYQVEIS